MTEPKPEQQDDHAVPGDRHYDRLAEIVHEALFYEDDEAGPVFRWSEPRVVSDDDPFVRLAVDAVVRDLWGSRAEIVTLIGGGPDRSPATSRDRWARWFEQCADEADDMPAAERAGLRVAASHLRDEGVVERVAAINLGPTEVNATQDQDRPCSCCEGDPATVCAACEQHACWAGRFMCEDSRTAGTRQVAYRA